MPYLVTFLASAILSLGSMFAVAPVLNTQLGAALPSATAVFETSLAAPITSSATNMTLTANAVRGGGSISGYNCFTIDEGSAQAETVCGTVSGTSVTSMSRGISQATGTTTVAALQFAHRRGANVKITDFPLIQILKAQNNGEDTFANPLRYDAALATTTIDDNDSNLVNVGLLNYVAFNGAGVIDATTAARGVGELATQAEIASSTSQGSSGVLLIPASAATSTCNGVTSPLRVLVTDNSGYLDDDCLPGTIAKNATTSGAFAITATSSAYIGAFPAWHIGKQVQVFSSTGTTTFSVPSGITKVKVRVQGAGGAGAGSTDNTNGGGTGGGAGGYAEEFVDVTGTSTIQVFVGTGGTGGTGNGPAGTWSTFGTNGFYLSGSGGLGGTVANASGGNGQSGGAGGCGTSGTINVCGSSGGGASVAGASGGAGGGSPLGGGGAGTYGSAVGGAGGNYGGGGGGAATNDSTDRAGGSGAQGIVIVEW